MPVFIQDLVAGELVSARRAKIAANFAAIANWILGAEASNQVMRLETGAPLPLADQGLVWHEDYASLMTWRSIGVYTGYASIELGKINYFDVGVAPTGWLECNGQSTPTRAALNALRGSSTLLDLRGEFIRGWDHGRGIDTGRARASVQGHAFQYHEHIVANEYHQAGTAADGTKYPGINGVLANAVAKSTNAIVAGATHAAETRPRNVALMACIKF